MPNLASNIFLEKAKRNGKTKKTLAGNLLSRAKGPAKETFSPRGNRMHIKMMIQKGSTHPRVKAWEGEAKPQNPLAKVICKSARKW